MGNTSPWNSPVPLELIRVRHIPHALSWVIPVRFSFLLYAHILSNPAVSCSDADQRRGAGIRPGPLLHTKALRLGPGEGLHPTRAHLGQVGSNCFFVVVFSPSLHCNAMLMDVWCVLCLHRALQKTKKQNKNKQQPYTHNLVQISVYFASFRKSQMDVTQPQSRFFEVCFCPPWLLWSGFTLLQWESLCRIWKTADVLLPLVFEREENQQQTPRRELVVASALCDITKDQIPELHIENIAHSMHTCFHHPQLLPAHDSTVWLIVNVATWGLRDNVPLQRASWKNELRGCKKNKLGSGMKWAAWVQCCDLRRSFSSCWIHDSPSPLSFWQKFGNLKGKQKFEDYSFTLWQTAIPMHCLKGFACQHVTSHGCETLVWWKPSVIGHTENNKESGKKNRISNSGKWQLYVGFANMQK